MLVLINKSESLRLQKCKPTKILFSFFFKYDKIKSFDFFKIFIEKVSTFFKIQNLWIFQVHN